MKITIIAIVIILLAGGIVLYVGTQSTDTAVLEGESNMTTDTPAVETNISSEVTQDDSESINNNEVTPADDFSSSNSDEPSSVTETEVSNPPTPDTVETDGNVAADTPTVETDTSSAAEMETQSVERSFDIVGTNFMFNQSEIRVQAGDTVTINFTSDEGFHDWVVDEFNAATEQVGRGEQTSVTFVAGEEGTYEYYCSVGQHRASGMVGTLIVE